MGGGSGDDPFRSLPIESFAAIKSPTNRARLPTGRAHQGPGLSESIRGLVPGGAHHHTTTGPELHGASPQRLGQPSASSSSSKQQQQPTKQEGLVDQVKRCFAEEPGVCRLRAAAGPQPRPQIVRAVTEELRREIDVEPPAGFPRDRVNAVDLSEVVLPRLDPNTNHAVAGADPSLPPDPDATVHALFGVLGGFICPGDVHVRAHRVTRLFLNHAEVYDGDAAYLATLLRSPACTLVHLQLRGNRISPVGANALKKVLKFNTRLRSLDLSENPWLSLPDFEPSGDEVLRVIAERLDNNVRGVSNMSALQRLLH